MATIFGGNGTGALDSSLYLLNRNDTTGAGTTGDGEQVYLNVSNGNLALSHLDEFLPSESNSFLTLRTYNSRGQFTLPCGEGWTLNEFSQLSRISPTQIVVLNGDGSQFSFEYDANAGLYRSMDGAGAYQTISFDSRSGTYSLVQSNQTVLTYNSAGRLLQTTDTNGNTVRYGYDPTGFLSSISDNSGHRLDFGYQSGHLTSIRDETGTVLARYQYSGDQLISVTDRAGETTSYSYYPDGTLRSVTLPAAAGETVRTLSFTYTSGPGGPLVSSFTDADGNTTQFRYNFTTQSGQIQAGTTQVVDAEGRVTQYSFDSKGQITKVSDANGFDTVYGYDANENLTSIIDANGSGVVQSDSSYYRNLRRDLGVVDPSTGLGKLVSALTPAEIAALQAHFTTTLTYDSNGNVASRTDASGNVTKYTYTSFNKVASTTSGNGYQTRYTYDAHQNLTQILAANGDLTQLIYDALGNLTTKTVYRDPSDLKDPAKQEVTQYFYDAFGNNIQTLDPQGNTTRASFDHFGNRLTQTDANGGVTSYQYDAENRLISTTDPLGNVTLNFYDSVGNRIAVQDASRHTVTYLYDANNLLVAIVDPSADASQAATRTRTTRYSYDVVGNRTSTTDAEGRTTSYTYDALNRLVTVTTPQVTDASGKPVSYTTTYGYDGVGNRITVIDNDGNRTDTIYNSNNLVRRVTDASGHITEYAYDADLNKMSIVVGAELAPSLRQVLRFEYDKKDRLTSSMDALGNKQGYVYDGANNRISATDANGNTTDYTYDRDNRLLIETKPAVLDPVSGQPVRYTIQHQYDASGNLIALTDQNGHTVRTVYDQDNRAVLVSDANGIQSVYTYDSRGNRTSVQLGVQAHVDSTGRVVIDSAQDAQVETYTYDEFNQVVAHTDGVGNALISSDSTLYVQMRQQLGIIDSSTGQGKSVAQLTASDIQTLQARFTEHYTYDRVGNHTSTTDHLGNTASVTYDALNREATAIDALGHTSTMAYDGNGNVVARTDALQRKTTYAYDALNRLTDTTDALGTTTHRLYDSFGNLTATIAAVNRPADARTTRYAYDLDNRLTSTTDAMQNTRSFDYDAVGNRLHVTDGRGKTTTYVYDALNRNIAIIDPLGLQTRMVYDGVGNRISLVNAKGGITRFTYDFGNRQIEVVDAEGRQTVYQYDVRGNKISQTTADGTTSYLYDAEGNLRQVADPLKNVTRSDYDAVYNRVQTTDANGNVTSYGFDALRREVKVVDAAGGVTQYKYDEVGNRVAVIDPNSYRTSYEYDAGNQLIRVTDATGVDTTYAYDAVGNQVTIVHAANRPAEAATEKFTYNLDNRLISHKDAMGNIQGYQYDGNGNVKIKTDALGHQTIYQYDDDNRVAAITDPVGNTTHYRYDANGNRVQVTDARNYVSTNYYNSDDELVLSVDNDGYATRLTYDANGNVIAQTLYAKALGLPVDPQVQPTPISSAQDRTTTFTYDSLNRVKTRTDGEGFVTQYVYDAVGNKVETHEALDLAGTQFEITHSYYDPVGRLSAQVSPQGYLTRYGYDAAGNRTSETRFDQAVSVPANGTQPQPVAGDSGRTTRYGYDKNNRLVRQTSPLGVDAVYQYDARGNRKAVIEAAGTPDERATQYAYDYANRLVQTTDALQVVTRLELDANGNVTVRHEADGTNKERVTYFTYDANNRVISQTDPLRVTTEITYDVVGNVQTRTVAAHTTDARSSSYTYDGDGHQVSATDATQSLTTYQYDAAGNQTRITQGAGTTLARTNLFTYDRANRLVSASDALGVITNYQYDGVGNKVLTVQAVRTSDERQTHYRYDLDDRLIQVTDPTGGITQYQYDAQGNQTSVIDANGGVRTNTFDAAGRALSSLSPAGILTRNTYDLRGNLVSTTQSFANGSDARTVTYAYDALNRQIQITDGEGFSTSILYDYFGNQTQVTHGQYLLVPSDPSYSAVKAAQAFPEINKFSYDAADRMTSMVDGMGNVTSYGYDLVGNRTSTTDANLNTTSYTYDLSNRLLQTTTPEGGITRNTYDALGNKKEEDQLQSGDATTGRWRQTTFAYDANGHVTSQTDPMGVVTTYTYDRMGNLLSQTSADGPNQARTVRMEYDLDNRKIADIDALQNRTTYAYDAMGNRIKVTDPLGHIAHYYYNAANQLIEVVDPQGYVNTFAYDAAGNQTVIRLYGTPVGGAVDDRSPPTAAPGANDRVTVQQYDHANRLVSKTAPDGSVSQYTYDAVGNKVSEVQFANTSTPRTLRYAYDADSRLITFTDVDGSLTTFGYDRANNKTSQTISSTTDPNRTRTTTYTYDVNNRELSETFDPSGLAIVQSFSYDHLANRLSMTDGNGHTTTFAYDLNNRLVSQTDPLGNTTQFKYDGVGNKISTTAPSGYTTDYVYDLADRLIQEIAPEVQVYTIAGGFTTLRPVTTHVYDANGNEVQTIDANGAITTRYFDGNKRVTAQISADNALTTFNYDAAGDKISQTLYMTRLGPGAQNPNSFPGLPAGESRLTSYDYDLMGRLTQTTYPPTEITTLNNTGTGNPSSVTGIKRVTERNVYDALGNVVQTYDRNGNRTVYYYDAKGRIVATVDALGYLTEWDYDSQGNKLEQRVYTMRLDPSSITPDSRPTPPGGEVYVTDIEYDTASRKVREIAPQLTVDPAQPSNGIRPTTTYTYDKVGNQITKTLGAGTPQAVTEYSYYDAANHRVAVVDSARVLSFYQYDANGNVTTQRRFINPISIEFDLTRLTAATVLSAVRTYDNLHDEESDFTYDALNRQIRASDLMAAGNLVKQFGYDAVGNKTYTKDEDSYVTQAGYDGMGRIVQSISQDNSGTEYDYDAAGYRTLIYTGVLMGGAQPPAPATNISATPASNGIALNWTTAGSSQHPLRTWVVYDTVTHDKLADYAKQTSSIVSADGKGQTVVNGVKAGDTVYFRIVTEDGAGNETWTAEQSTTLPPRFSMVQVLQSSPNSLTIVARFDPGATNQQVVYGTGGNLNQTVAFVLQTTGVYLAVLSGLADPRAVSLALQWKDTAGNNYQSSVASAVVPESNLGVSSVIRVDQSGFGASTAFQMDVRSQVSFADAYGLTSIQANYRPAGSGAPFSSVSATPIGGTQQGSQYYNFYVGFGYSLAPGSYEFVLTGTRADGTSATLNQFTLNLTDQGGSGPYLDLYQHTVSWAPPVVGNDQLVIFNGKNVSDVRAGDQVLTTISDPVSNAEYAVFSGQDSADLHLVNVASTANARGGYDVSVQAILSAAEAANIKAAGSNSRLFLQWRPANGSATAFSSSAGMLLTPGSNTFSRTLSSLAPGQYDLQLYYTDVQGRQVIVERRRIDVATVDTTWSGHSLTVLSREVNGTVSMDSDFNVIVSQPTYNAGPSTSNLDLDALTSSLALRVSASDKPGGSLTTDGRATGYFTEIQYDALGNKIRSNEGDGLVRQFGVDGNGNVVQTNLLGDPHSPDYDPAKYITTYTAYDGRNRKVAEFGAPMVDPRSGAATRPVDRYEYNVLDKTTAHTDALGNTTRYEYNALGTQTASIDPFGFKTQTLVDAFGNAIEEVTAGGHTTLKVYDAQGHLIVQHDAAGNATEYYYDSFGRKIREVNGLGRTTTYAYDQRDRLTSQTDALGNTETFSYDGRNNRISMRYPLGQRNDVVYDSVGRTIDNITWLNGKASHSYSAYDSYGNLISETDAMGRTKLHVYGGFGRLLEDIDEDRNVTAYNYDVFGRRISDYDPSGAKNIQKSYDQAGRVTSVRDLATGVSTTYTYDLMGHRVNEVVTTPGDAHDRNISYQYDSREQLVRWKDSITGDNLNSMYDAEGNLVRERTDDGYDPLGQNAAGNPFYRYVDHTYLYDADRRVTFEYQNSTDAAGKTTSQILNAYTYDAASNRLTWNNGSVVVRYTYDADERVVEGDYYTGSDSNRQVWTYDAMGNVLAYTTFKNSSQTSSTVNTYNDANRQVTSNKDGEITTNTYDLTLRITQTTLNNNGKTYHYNYSYYGDGREKTVQATGDAKGNSLSTYDANKIRSRVDLGQGDGQDHPEYKTIISDNEGHILYELHDDGKKSSQLEQHEFVYANGNSVGENIRGVDGKLTVQLDTNSYAELQNLSDSNPGSNLSYTVQAGDTLQGIAGTMYGNPSLWFVIADANGVSAGDALKVGTTLRIPNTIESGTITADNHKVYSESDIVGSTLPNLKSPPPPHHGGCGSIIAIIIVVVIAVVATIATAGLATAILGGAAAATSASSGAIIAAYAAAGVVVGAVASAVQQGLFMALGYQKQFSWKDVAAGAVAGGFAGAAAGVGKAAEAAVKLGKLAEAGLAVRYAQVAEAALDVAKVASQQLIENGKITSWTGLAAAAIAGYAEGAAQLDSADKLGAAAVGQTAAKSTSSLSKIANYVTPWAQLAETYARNGKLEPADWANAVGSTLSQAIAGKFGARDHAAETIGGMLENGALRLGANALVAGALSHYDKQAALSYIENGVGQEAGQFIGGILSQGLQSLFSRSTRTHDGQQARAAAAPDTPESSKASTDGTLAAEGTPTTDRTGTTQAPPGYFTNGGGWSFDPTLFSNGSAADDLRAASYGTNSNGSYTEPTSEFVPQTDDAVPAAANVIEGGGHYDKAQQAGYDAVIDRTGSVSDAKTVADQIGLRENLESRIAAADAAGDADLAATLKHDYKLLTYALVSSDVYYNSSIQPLLPEGVSRITDAAALKKLGLQASDLSDSGLLSGFYSAVYYDSYNAQYIVADRGTFPKNPNDVVTDFLQAQSIYTRQYDEAINVAKKLRNGYEGSLEDFQDHFMFTGHSLGGGLATAQALAVAAPAYTFNALGLSKGTIDRYHLDIDQAPELVNAFSVEGELVNTVQDVKKAMGSTPGPDAPAVVGTRYILPAISPPKETDTGVQLGEHYGFTERILHTVDLHLQDSVISSVFYVSDYHYRHVR